MSELERMLLGHLSDPKWEPTANLTASTLGLLMQRIASSTTFPDLGMQLYINHCPFQHIETPAGSADAKVTVKPPPPKPATISKPAAKPVALARPPPVPTVKQPTPWKAPKPAATVIPASPIIKPPAPIAPHATIASPRQKGVNAVLQRKRPAAAVASPTLVRTIPPPAIPAVRGVPQVIRGRGAYRPPVARPAVVAVRPPPVAVAGATAGAAPKGGPNPYQLRLQQMRSSSGQRPAKIQRVA